MNFGAGLKDLSVARRESWSWYVWLDGRFVLKEDSHFSELHHKD